MLQKRIATFVAGLATVAASMLVTAVPAQAAPPGDLLGWVNTLRVSSLAPALTTDDGLTSVAQQWAIHMATTGVVAHNASLATQAPQGWSKMGENVASGYSLGGVYNIFTFGAARAAMTDPAYNRTGIGVATDAKGQLWVVEDFGAYPPPSPATMVFPTPSSKIFPMAQPFSWNQAPGGLYYCLTVGTTPGGADLLNSGLLQAGQLSYPVPALPGGLLYARIYTFVPGAWVWNDVPFSVTGAATATLSRPTDGATVDTTQPFTWNPVMGAGYYGFNIGTTKGGYDLVVTGPLPAIQTSYLVPALPAGPTLWIRMYSFIAGSWNHYTDVSFTAAHR